MLLVFEVFEVVNSVAPFGAKVNAVLQNFGHERKIYRVATQYFDKCNQIERAVAKNLEDITYNLVAFDWFVAKGWLFPLLPVDSPVPLALSSSESPETYQFTDSEPSD